MVPDLRSLGVVAMVLAAALAANFLIENPLIEKLATEKANHATTILITDAANRARREAEDHYQRVGEDALEAYRQASEARDSLHRQVQATLEEDIETYEHALEAAGRSCKLDRDNFEWLRPQPR